MAKLSITTPIYYVNARPHIGHAYTTFAADVLAAWHRMRGDDVLFLAGTDENSQKNSEAAARELGKPHSAIARAEVQTYVDRMSAVWQQTWDTLGIRYDRFIRTTEPAHIAGVYQFINAVRDRGDIIPGTYRGWYCVDCEAFLPEKDLAGGMCPFHTRAVERIEEQNYFFRLSKYRDALLAHIAAHPHFVQPESRRNEIVAYIRDHLEDISVSRPMRQWGIPFPGDHTQAVYVWFDALVNYLTGIGYGSDDAAFARWWPSLHLVGKDILKFHCALWPAMLMSAGLPLPERVFAHGFFTVDGEKMSKSRGNVVDPVVMAERYGIDALRCFLFREIPFGGDGDFSEARLRERYVSDLQHGIGNLAARTLTMLQKYTDGRIPAAGSEPLVRGEWDRYAGAMEGLALHDALAVAMDVVRQGDHYIEAQKPWALAKDLDGVIPSEARNPGHGSTRDSSVADSLRMTQDAKRERLHEVLGNTAELLRHAALMFAPFAPQASASILDALEQRDWRSRSLSDLQRWGGIIEGTAITDLGHLFPPLEERRKV